MNTSPFPQYGDVLMSLIYGIRSIMDPLSEEQALDESSDRTFLGDATFPFLVAKPALVGSKARRIIRFS